MAARRADIDRVFGNAIVEAMLEALSGTPGEWAQKTAAALAQKSPKSLKLTLAAIRQARNLGSLEAALNVEFRLTVRLFEDGEFPEGVRALIVDKDRKPKWSPPRLADVRPTWSPPTWRRCPRARSWASSRRKAASGNEMRRIRVSSSMIASIGYLARSRMLEIEFVSGSIFTEHNLDVDARRRSTISQEAPSSEGYVTFECAYQGSMFSFVYVVA